MMSACVTCKTGSNIHRLFSACSVFQLAPPMMNMSLPAVRVCGSQRLSGQRLIRTGRQWYGSQPDEWEAVRV